VIDSTRSGFLDSTRFVFREAIGHLGVGACWLAALSLVGCAPKPTPQPVEDSITSGRIRIVSAAEAFEVTHRVAEDFMTRYPEAVISVDRGTSRQAVQALFAAECDLAILSRELDADERRAAVEGGLEVDGYRFARSGLVFLVHETNPVRNLALEDLRRIYRGEWQDWRDAGGASGRIVPVIQELNSDVTESFLERVMMGEPIRAAVLTAASDSAAVAAVRSDAGAIAFVGLAAGHDRLRALRIASLRGLPYVQPDPETVHREEYPLSRAFYAYARTEGQRLANGFVTHLTSMEGQRLVRDRSLVPANVPVRFVRRSPMLSTHSRGDSTNTP
jgi:phosphate transport system substrate-binding protein